MSRRRRVLASVAASLWLVDAFCCAALAIAAVAAVSPAVLVRLPTAVGGGRCAGGGGGSGAGVRAGVRGQGGGAGISGCVVGLDGCVSAPPAVVAAAARPGPRLSGRVPGCSEGLSGGGRLFRGWPIVGVRLDAGGTSRGRITAATRGSFKQLEYSCHQRSNVHDMRLVVELAL